MESSEARHNGNGYNGSSHGPNVNSGKKLSWVKRLMKNSSYSHGHPQSSRRTSASGPASVSASRGMTQPHRGPRISTTSTATAVATLPAVVKETEAAAERSRFDGSSFDDAASSDLASRVPILSLSSRSLNASTTTTSTPTTYGDLSSTDQNYHDRSSQQSTTATSVAPTTATNAAAPGQHHTSHHHGTASNYIHIAAVHNTHATMDDSSIVTLASSNRRCRSFDSNTNLSTLGIPPASIIERSAHTPVSPTLQPQSNRSSTLAASANAAAGHDGGSIKTNWTAEKERIGE